MKDYFLEFLLTLSWRGGQNCFIGISWGKTSFLDKLCLSIVFPDIEQELFGHFPKTFRRWYQNWLLRVHRSIMTKKYWTFFSILDIARKIIEHLSMDLCQGYQHCNLRVQGTISGQFFLENFCFLCLFRSREINYRPFVQNGATWLSELHSKIHKNISRKTYSPEKVVFSIIFRLDWYSFETLLNFSVGVFKTAYYKFMKTFEPKFFPWKNLLRNNFEIGVQTFQIFAGISSKVAETAIHVSV